MGISKGDACGSALCLSKAGGTRRLSTLEKWQVRRRLNVSFVFFVRFFF